MILKTKSMVGEETLPGGVAGALALGAKVAGVGCLEDKEY